MAPPHTFCQNIPADGASRGYNPVACIWPLPHSIILSLFRSNLKHTKLIYEGCDKQAGLQYLLFRQYFATFQIRKMLDLCFSSCTK